LSDRNARVALALLFAVCLTNYIDRFALAILQVPIKAELGLTDSQLGMLTGLAFFVPFTLFSWPVARLADTRERRYVLTGVLLIWSAATALISTATSLLALVLLRTGVALGEAGCLPTSYSLIADYFPPSRRAQAIAIFVLAFPVGSMIGLAGGGLLSSALGWRQAFLAIGLGGVALAPIVFLLLREPRRGGSDGATRAAPSAVAPPSFEAMGRLWRTRAFRYLALGAAAQAFVVSALLAWLAPFYARVHHLPLSRVAIVTGVLTGIGGGIGSLLGGGLSDRLGRRDRRWYAWLPAMASVVLVPVGIGQFLVPGLDVSLALGLVAGMLLNVFIAPVYAVTQSLFPPNMRAVASGTVVAMTAIIGSGVGPYATGVLSDRLLAQGFGAESLRFALCSALAAAPVAAWLFSRAARHLRGAP
jgi:predicted MFS family arabinose efflux permease